MIPARSCSISRVEFCIGSVEDSPSGDVVGEGDDDGIDCATARKNSSMY